MAASKVEWMVPKKVAQLADMKVEMLVAELELRRVGQLVEWKAGLLDDWMVVLKVVKKVVSWVHRLVGNLAD